MQKIIIIKKIVSARFLFPLSTHKTSVHADRLLVLLSYLSPQLFFKIKPFAGLSFVLLNYSELSS